jgi:hypothetical protein
MTNIRNSYKNFFRKPKGNRLLERAELVEVIILKWVLKTEW